MFKALIISTILLLTVTSSVSAQSVKDCKNLYTVSNATKNLVEYDPRNVAVISSVENVINKAYYISPTQREKLFEDMNDLAMAWYKVSNTLNKLSLYCYGHYGVIDKVDNESYIVTKEQLEFEKQMEVIRSE